MKAVEIDLRGLFLVLAHAYAYHLLCMDLPYLAVRFPWTCHFGGEIAPVRRSFIDTVFRVCER